MSPAISPHSKENKVPWMSAAHAGRSLFFPLAQFCCLLSELLSLPAIVFCALHKVGTRMHLISCLGLGQSSSVIFSAAPGTSFPQQGWDLSFLYCLWQNEKEKLSLTPSE